MAKQSPLKYTIIDTHIGKILIVGSKEGLQKISIYISRQSALGSIAQQFPGSIASPGVFADLPKRLEQYARGRQIIFNDKLDFSNATPFKQAVWEATRAIQYGETRSYEWIAQRIGKPGAARAVGQALKSNPLPIVVPCHRVIGKHGSLTGFSCGLELKKCLLDMEASSPSKKRAH
jgi:methylated-DNA-[protein]-cysteine S-methyltransferase